MMCMTVALMLATSCNKIEENTISVEGNGRTAITAVAKAIGAGTKAHNQYSYDVLWDKGDKISVTGVRKANTFTGLDESAGTNKGKFIEDTPHMVSKATSKPSIQTVCIRKAMIMYGPQSRPTIRWLRCMQSRP
ncbi:MAG: hypothetical protein KBS95_00940 [Alistipes sp.]|nr:hypothetical protein [Candidatus Alistipes equi]